MFKLFKKYAVLDSIETDHYEAYRIFEQSAGGYAISRRDAEKTLLTIYYKAKTTKSGIKEVGLSQKYNGFWSAAVEGLLISCVRDQGKYDVEHWSKLRDFAVMLETHNLKFGSCCGRWTTDPDDRHKVLQCLLEAKQIIQHEISKRAGSINEGISEPALKRHKEIKEACERLNAECEENNVS